MFGRHTTSRRSQPNQPTPETDSTTRNYAPDRRQHRGQIDLLREIQLTSPWYF
jgi:hypothetical protein